MKLRPYQEKQIYELRTQFAKGHKRIILCSPTGSGKTVVFTSIISATINKDMFNRVLVITDRIELFKQTWSALRELDIDPKIYNAQVKPKEPVTGRVVVAMIETLKRRWKKYGSLPLGEFDLIIIDEAHKGNFKKVFDIYPETRVIGATATPLASTKRDPLKNYYNQIVETVDIPALIEQGFLVPEEAYTMRLIDESQLQKSSSTGDFTEASQYKAFSETKVFKGLLENYQKRGIGRKSIIFCPNIQMVDDVYDSFTQSGYDDVFRLHSKINDQREKILKDFHNSDSGVMINCGILTTGYDHPPIEVCFVFRATYSLPLWLQMVGRCSRIDDGKTQMTVIDMGGNIDRLGLWSAPRDWKDWFWNPPKVGIPQPPPTKDCPECEAMLLIHVMECPHCGHKFETKEKEMAEGELVKILPLIGRKVSTLNASDLYRLETQKMIKPTFAWRVARTNGDIYLKEYASISGKKSGWVYYQRKNGVGYTDYTININFKAKK